MVSVARTGADIVFGITGGVDLSFDYSYGGAFLRVQKSGFLRSGIFDFGISDKDLLKALVAKGESG